MTGYRHMHKVSRFLKENACPCHHIPLNTSGETLDSLYGWGTEKEWEKALRGWLRETISATLMTPTDMLFSRCLDFATVVAASALVGNQCGTMNCPHLVGTAACAGRS